MADRIVELSQWAHCDIYRATTHNKGIMNGIDAVAIATGQDWRAIEASCHAYASRDGAYSSLSRYWITDDSLLGELELPLPVATRGGSLAINPVYSTAMSIMVHPDAKTLAKIMTCVGLAQNFAALRAIASEGIQRGHMSLHARNIAVAAGATSDQVEEVVRHITHNNCINLASASLFLQKLQK